MMAFEKAETFNKIMFLIFVAILFALKKLIRLSKILF